MLNDIVILLPMFVTLVLTMLWAFDFASDWSQNPSRSGGRWAMMCFLIACTLLYVGHSIYFMHQTELIPLTDSIYSFCSPAVFPLYYIYVCELTGHRGSRPTLWLWLLPAIVCGVGVSVLYALMDAEQTDLFIGDYLYYNDWSRLSGTALTQAHMHWLLKVVFGVQIIPIALLGIRRINYFNDMLERNMSDANQSQLMMVKLLFVLFIITSVLSALSNFLGRYRFVDDVAILAIPSTLFSALIFLQVYIAMKQDRKPLPRFTLEEEERGMKAKDEKLRMKGEKMVKAAERMHELRERIEKVMDEERLFLQNGLKISDLAELLCCNRNYIYRAINIEMGISFSEYINKKRIEYAKQLIENNSDLQMNELYMRAGFSSSSSFYRCFRQYVGCTPKEYLERKKKCRVKS